MSSKWLIQPGTGNRFDAALAAGIAESLTLSEAVKLVNYAGALMVATDGVIPALPTRMELDARILNEDMN